MQDADFSDEFCLFIQTAIPAVKAAELLLALSAQPDAWWDTAQLPGNLQPTDAGRYLELFRIRGLLFVRPDKRVQFRPASETLAAHVQTLAQAYEQRPVTLVRMIYELRDAKIRSFSDAFKLRGK
jgi:hypothetical protein